MFLYFSRYRFKEGKDIEGFELLKHQAQSLRDAPGCEGEWLGQGQHPSTEFIMIGRFRDEEALRAYEGRLRSDPVHGGDFFALLRLTTQPPEVTSYEVRDTP
ncbi:MAG TPA: antibiotic biosynthesis monooxygenase [Thermoplasmata archaeon]|nr:antibiotic biosynthesis monooxygenase [Thermoplasmata archaeon]